MIKIIIRHNKLFLLAVCISAHAHSNTLYSQQPSVQTNIVRIDKTKTIFPIHDYPQDTEKWIPKNKHYHTPFMSTDQQSMAFKALMNHYFGQNSGDPSPWNRNYISTMLSNTGAVTEKLSKDITQFTHSDARYYGENFLLLDSEWKERMRHLASIVITEKYHQTSRGIILKETAVRLLPTTHPAFDSPSPGQGYPFDMLQDSSFHPGEPIYIAGITQDKSWSFVISPSKIGWVESSDIAYVDDVFIQRWVTMAKKSLGAVINDHASFVDKQGVFRFTARTGTLLPLTTLKGERVVAIPVKNTQGNANIHYARLPEKIMHQAPVPATPENMSMLIKNMQGKNYGWGNIYDFNDCSSEIRNLMLPFGIYLPRDSQQQSLSGKHVDLSHYSTKERIEYLMAHGKPLTTLIYIGGHVMLYIGNADWKGQTVPITYQNLWGLRPANSSNRSIIGKSVFFPLLSRYPEDPKLESLAGKSVFIMTWLN
ncbi:putative cell wall-associated hydrolase [Yersinia kristensenii]|uniref:C40 family peptidase n=1 Tax=Yersinia TaxID=629 RepID=UPI0005E15649|nr:MULTISPECIES: SH3 domain-containing C40 family peptidase [Yersinia]CNG82157.1 putative cell wall-associated hydrolase [Yersinia kristensenii]